MRHRRLCFGIILLFMCVLLYFSNYCLNLNINLKVFKNLDGPRSTNIPSIVVHSTNIFPEINKKCPQISEPKKTSILWKNKWQRLRNESRLFLYSAYADNRDIENKYIRIIAMSKGKFVQRIYCRVWYDGTKSSVAEVDVQELWIASWDFAKPDQYYRPLLLSCPVKSASTRTAVSVIDKPCQKPSNVYWLNSIKSDDRKKDFVVCLKPLHFQLDMTLRVLEWLELQFILGADTISIYKYHLHPETLKALKSYEKPGRLTIKEHTFPGDSSKNPEECRTFLTRNVWQKRRHEMVVYNDCFYRHIHSHKYIINLDLDEAIIPLMHNSWNELLNRAMATNPKLSTSASISVPNVYFFDSFGEEFNSSVPKYFHMLRHLHRSANCTPPGFAQKSFFSANYTLSVSNHYALRSLYSHIRTNSAIGKDLAHLHHYRTNCPPKMEKDCKENFMKFRIRDKVILKFKDKLIKSVDLKIQDLNVSTVMKEVNL